MTTTEGNKLIADFMGIKINHIGKGDLYKCPVTDLPTTERELEYHLSWDWLIPVVDKIENSDTSNFGYAFSIDNWNVTIKNLLSGEIILAISPSSTRVNSKIEAVWLACVKFIQWYNQNKQS